MHKFSLMTVICAAGAALGSATAPMQAADYFVSPQGADTNAGTKTQPFATLQRARDAIRAAGAPGGATVWLGDGVYTQRFELTAQDSGTAQSPIVYRALPGAQPRFVAGRVVAPAAQRIVTDAAVLARLDTSARGAVREVDLAALNIGHAAPFSDTFRENSGLFEVYAGGARLPLSRLPLSRWPNEASSYVTMQSVLDSGSTAPEKRGGTFVYRGARPERWRAALPGGVWLRGFWRVPWTIEAVRVQDINTEKRTITFAAPVQGGIGSKYSKEVNGTRQGDGKENWYALNLLEEIDRPGEWCVDFAAKKLYLWPVDAQQPLIIADNRAPVMAVKEASNIMLRGLTIETGLGNGIEIDGGSAVTVAGCTLRNLGDSGVTIRGGARHRVVSSDFYDLGLNGISFTGGDRKTLAPAGHEILNNEIQRIGLHFPTAAIVAGQGVGATAVGNRVAHNRIHDVPNAGIYYSGNENVLEFNEIYRVGLDSGDLGGFYSTGGWTSQGNIVRHNFVHHSPAANAFYVDDGDSGDTITGNIVYKTASGGFVGGGHDNILRGNIIIASAKAMHLDSRGVSRGYTATDKRLGNDLRSINPQNPPWSTRYPSLATLLERRPEVPSGNIIVDNAFIACAKDINLSGKPEELRGVSIAENFTAREEGLQNFTDAAKLDFRLRPNAALLQKLPGFAPIPFDRIGLYTDEYRTQITPRAAELDVKPRPIFNSETDVAASNQRRP